MLHSLTCVDSHEKNCMSRALFFVHSLISFLLLFAPLDRAAFARLSSIIDHIGASDAQRAELHSLLNDVYAHFDRFECSRSSSFHQHNVLFSLSDPVNSAHACSSPPPSPSPPFESLLSCPMCDKYATLMHKLRVLLLKHVKKLAPNRTSLISHPDFFFFFDFVLFLCLLSM